MAAVNVCSVCSKVPAPASAAKFCCKPACNCSKCCSPCCKPPSAADLRRQSFADPHQGRLLIVSVVAHHARQSAQLLEQPGTVFDGLFFQSGNSCECVCNVPFSAASNAPAICSCCRADASRIRRSFSVSARADTSACAGPVAPWRREDLRVLTQGFDKRPTIAGYAQEAMGQLPFDLVIDPFEDGLLAALDQEAAKHGNMVKLRARAVASKA